LPATQAVTEIPTETATATPPLPSATPSPAQTATPTVTLTPDPYEVYTIEHLSRRAYGEGEALRIVEQMAVNSFFTRTLVVYPSDGLNIYGFMNVPRQGQPPYPVVIAIHGYIEPELYTTLDYTTRYADALARAGYLVLHPNLRGYPPSDDGDNLFRVGMAADVLNLIAQVKQMGGQSGPLALADPQRIGLWGHSMGGGISTKVMTASPDVDAVVLYGPMSGDEQKNYERIYSYFSGGTRGLEELAAPAEVFPQVSPIFYLERVTAPVSLHHGEQDEDVPLDWSRDLCQRLERLGKTVECFIYKGQPHTFYGDGDALFIQRTIEFYNRWLR
jgi:dipeptidyl aminopeptidase/acylaminoacyl peptidase